MINAEPPGRRTSLARLLLPGAPRLPGGVRLYPRVCPHGRYVPGDRFSLAEKTSIGYAHLVNCNSTSYPGTGGGTATIFVQFHGDGNSLGFCSTSFNYAINSHFTIQAGG